MHKRILWDPSETHIVIDGNFSYLITNGWGAGDGYGLVYDDCTGEGVGACEYGEHMRNADGGGDTTDPLLRLTRAYGSMDRDEDWGCHTQPGCGWGRGNFGYTYREGSGYAYMDNDVWDSDHMLNYVKAKNSGVPEIELDLEILADPTLSRFAELDDSRPYS